MKNNLYIQLKAAFLIIVFSFNTIIGFACSLGLDMGFNTHHHNEEAMKVTGHVHVDGKMHEHKEADHQYESKDDKDNCCNNKVTQFSQLDKLVPQSLAAINCVFFTTFISSFYNVAILATSQNVSVKYFYRSHPPPVQDIRIAIQSFQI